MTQQDFDGPFKALLRCPDQCTPAMRVIDPVGIGTGLEKDLYNLRVIVAGGLHEGCITTLVAEIDHGARFEKLFHNSEISVLC